MEILSNTSGSGATADLKTMIEEGAFLADVRTPAEFAEGYVKGSVNVPLDRIAAELATFQHKKNIIVFCRSGARSSQAKAILNQHGFNNVINGGTLDYINQFV
ncbi:rhodanese-like domain-containing protein [Ferruginibacter paludis]|uniref:rhodanese-like domain-containing protein n=1 Tax=Ferruginibacter paludis TaxID=1310417 RepID=UPI0025B5B59D|nr:rhodanese-like domain-containing protein [Ferruginibacter paludis]MDN3656525.1 rhodanese-like domain-containing protein [Ferruginibacter paludis]